MDDASTRASGFDSTRRGLVCLRVWRAVALAGIAAAGCGRTWLYVHPAARGRRIDSIAVLDFEERVRDTDTSITAGVVAPQQSGRAVADMVRRALAEHGTCRVMPREETQKKLRAGRIAFDPSLQTPGPVLLGKALDVDAVVMGRVDEYGLSYRYFMQRASVRGSFWCVQSETGRRLWNARFAKKRRFAHERDLAEQAVQECIDDLPALDGRR